MTTPSSPSSAAHPAVVRLRTALDLLGDALVAARLDDLLAAEAHLLTAVATLPATIGDLDVKSRAALGRELVAARAALQRCRRLGATLGEIVRLSLASGAAGGYDSTGRGRDATPPGALEAMT